jgi:hypothetical protein
MSFWEEASLQETLKVIGAATGGLTVLYQILVLAFGPVLRNVVNPHRLGYLSLGISVFMAGYTKLAWSAKSWGLEQVWGAMRPLLTEQATEVSIVAATFACLLGALLVGLVSYCWWMFPPHPSGYRRNCYPKLKIHPELQRALNTYTKFSGGLESAGIIVAPLGPSLTDSDLRHLARILPQTARARSLEPPYLIECVSTSEVRSTLRTEHGNEAGVTCPQEMRIAWLYSVLRNAQQQIAGLEGFRRGELGEPETTLCTLRQGGISISVLHWPTNPEGMTTILYGITLSRKEVKNRVFEDHFEMLREAVMYIAPRMDLLLPTPPLLAELEPEALAPDEPKASVDSPVPDPEPTNTDPAPQPESTEEVEKHAPVDSNGDATPISSPPTWPLVPDASAKV